MMEWTLCLIPCESTVTLKINEKIYRYCNCSYAYINVIITAVSVSVKFEEDSGRFNVMGVHLPNTLHTVEAKRLHRLRLKTFKPLNSPFMPFCCWKMNQNSENQKFLTYLFNSGKGFVMATPILSLYCLSYFVTTLEVWF